MDKISVATYPTNPKKIAACKIFPGFFVLHALSSVPHANGAVDLKRSMLREERGRVPAMLVVHSTSSKMNLCQDGNAEHMSRMCEKFSFIPRHIQGYERIQRWDTRRLFGL